MQIQSAIKMIDRFFDIGTTPGSQVRQNLRKVLVYIDSQCKAEFINERKAIIGFLKRDETLTQDEIVEAQKQEREQLELQSEIEAFFVSSKKDEEFDQAIEEFEKEARQIDREFDEEEQRRLHREQEEEMAK